MHIEIISVDHDTKQVFANFWADTELTEEMFQRIEEYSWKMTVQDDPKLAKVMSANTQIMLLIRKALEMAGTQKELARILGVSARSISEWSKGFAPRAENLIRLQEYVEVGQQ